MPIINGSKYSCEPCIRGHRTASCAHKDRVLLEIRKPGRPLESCGHDFATCTCGKVAELLAAGEVFFDGASESSQTVQPALRLMRAAKPKAARTEVKRRPSKVRKSKGRRSSSSLITTPVAQSSQQDLSNHQRGSTNDTTIQTSSNRAMSHASSQSDLTVKNREFLHHQTQQGFLPQGGIPSSQTYPSMMGTYASYSSRIENICMTSEGQLNQTRHIRSYQIDPPPNFAIPW